MNNRFWFILIGLNFVNFPLYIANAVSTDLTPFVGYRQDNVKWNTSTGASFKWKNLKFIDYGIKGKTSFRDRLFLKYDFGLAHLLDGSIQDNQYLIPGGASTSSSVKGPGLALRPNLGIGYKFKPNRWFSISPQLGYVYDLIYINNNRRSGPFASVKETMQWHGPWIGFDATAKARRWSFSLGAFYYFAFFRGKGNWKLSPTTPTTLTTRNTFSQSGNGHGVKGRAAIGYQVFNTVSIGIEHETDFKQVNNGDDSRKFASGVITKSTLSKLTWISHATRLTLTKTF